MDLRKVVAKIVVLTLMLVRAVAVAQTPKTPTFSITHNALPSAGVFPFKAQNLSLAQNDPAGERPADS